MRKIRRGITARGGDIERFDHAMDRRLMRFLVIGIPVMGALVVVLGMTNP